MSRQVTPTRTAALEAWVGLLRSHARLTRALSARLQDEHGLTLNDYEVLLQLSRAEEGYLKRVELAERVLLTASGITRLLEGLERAGWVEKASCPTDARVSYAVLTDAGREKLREASKAHLADVEEVLREQLSERELATLAELLGRLAAAPLDAGECAA